MFTDDDEVDLGVNDIEIRNRFCVSRTPPVPKAIVKMSTTGYTNSIVVVKKKGG
jgi:hypothetical protein